VRGVRLAGIGAKGNAYRVLGGKTERREHLEDVGIDMRAILK
jgi:hypothetical protein